MELEVIGAGRTTKVYRDGNTAIKLYLGAPPDEAHNEANRQTFAVEAGLPVPKVFGVRERDGGVALEMEYVRGQDVIRSKMDKEERKKALENFAALQNDVHKVDAKGQPVLSERLAWKIEHAPHLEANTIDILINRLADLDSGQTCLCHGDFHPLNVLDDGKKLWIINWVDATCGDPLADASRTYLLFKQHISRLAGMYLKLYCKIASADPDAVSAWLPVVAAARLCENLTGKETAFLIDIIHSGTQ
ncbi:MAG: phosphotransferase [Oscillospiraceae bacterium]